MRIGDLVEGVWLRFGDLVEDSVVCHNLSRSSCPLVFVIGVWFRRSSLYSCNEFRYTGLVACGRNSTLVGHSGKFLGDFGAGCFAVSGMY